MQKVNKVNGVVFWAMILFMAIMVPAYARGGGGAVGGAYRGPNGAAAGGAYQGDGYRGGGQNYGTNGYGSYQGGGRGYWSWRGGVWIWVVPPTYYPPPVYYAAPPVYYPPPVYYAPAQAPVELAPPPHQGPVTHNCTCPCCLR